MQSSIAINNGILFLTFLPLQYVINNIIFEIISHDIILSGLCVLGQRKLEVLIKFHFCCEGFKEESLHPQYSYCPFSFDFQLSCAAYLLYTAHFSLLVSPCIWFKSQGLFLGSVHFEIFYAFLKITFTSPVMFF